MVGPAEEVSSKMFRLLSFIGAGVLCTVAINKYRDWERKSFLKKQEVLQTASSDGVQQIME